MALTVVAVAASLLLAAGSCQVSCLAQAVSEHLRIMHARLPFHRQFNTRMVQRSHPQPQSEGGFRRTGLIMTGG